MKMKMGTKNLTQKGSTFRTLNVLCECICCQCHYIIKCLHFWASLLSISASFVPSTALTTMDFKIPSLHQTDSNLWVTYLLVLGLNHWYTRHKRQRRLRHWSVVMINRRNIFNFGHTLFCISTPNLVRQYFFRCTHYEASTIDIR